MIGFHRSLLGTRLVSLWLHGLNTHPLQISILLGNELPSNRHGLGLHLGSANNATLISMGTSQWCTLYDLIVPPSSWYLPRCPLEPSHMGGLDCVLQKMVVCSGKGDNTEGKADSSGGFHHRFVQKLKVTWTTFIPPGH